MVYFEVILYNNQSCLVTPVSVLLHYLPERATNAKGAVGGNERSKAAIVITQSSVLLMTVSKTSHGSRTTRLQNSIQTKGKVTQYPMVKLVITHDEFSRLLKCDATVS